MDFRELLTGQVEHHVEPARKAGSELRLKPGVDSRHYGGLGLGLWIARQSVEALGGELSVQSAPGQGATFTAELPRTRQPEQMANEPSSQLAPV